MKFLLLLVTLFFFNASAFQSISVRHVSKYDTKIQMKLGMPSLKINHIKSKQSNELFGKSINSKALYASTSADGKGPFNVVTTKIAAIFAFLANLLLAPLKFIANLFKSTSSSASDTVDKVAKKVGVDKDAFAKNYAVQKLREIDAALKGAQSKKKVIADEGRWPPNITEPPVPPRKMTITDLKDSDLRGKRVLVRCDLNVPLSKEGAITDDTRIRGSMQTIKYLSSKGAKVLLTSHLGRPKGGYEKKFSLAPIAPRISQLLGKPVKLVPDCVGVSVGKAVYEMKEGDVVLLENVRFYPEEEKNDKKFAKLLAKNADIYVNDAFGTAHRAHASTAGVTEFLYPSVAGFLLSKELDYLQGAVDVPKRPFAAIVGGSKVSTKISVIEAMLNKVDKLVLGGGMVFTFLKARGVSVGKSLVEDDQLELAKKL